jgi:hypothetical protein
MRKRVFWGTALGLWAMAGALQHSAGAEPRSVLQLTTPTVLTASEGSFVVQWDDRESAPDSCLHEITWYYGPRADGKARSRMLFTLPRDLKDALAKGSPESLPREVKDSLTRPFVHDAFTAGFARNWRAPGKFSYQWVVKEDPKDRRLYLAGPRNADPALSIDNPPQSCVVSVLMRPNGKGTFGVGLRVQGESKIELRNDGEKLKVQLSGVKEPLIDEVLPNLASKSWYWHDFAVRNKRGGDIEIRVRVYDEARSKLLLSAIELYKPPKDSLLLRNGAISLFGPADFAEVFADPWSVRWTDHTGNILIWDTSQVPDGKYFLFAEAIDEAGRVSVTTSGYQVLVRNPRPEPQDRVANE